MKNKILPIIIILLVLAVGIGIGVYFSKGKGEKSGSTKGGAALEKEGFAINMPEDWAEVGAPTGVSAMAVNVNEEITDPNAQKINFRSYFSVIYDILGGKSKEEYIQSAKESLSQVIPDMVITNEDSEVVNNRDTYFIEAEFNQRGVDFKILLVFIRGVSEDVWVLTFNTPRSNWNTYKNLFYQTVNSFQLK